MALCFMATSPRGRPRRPAACAVDEVWRAGATCA